MTRLKKIASVKTFFHGTSMQRFIEIINSGVIGTDKYMDNGGNSEQVFLTDSPARASHYGLNLINDSENKSLPDWPVVLEINVDTNNLQPDLDDYYINADSDKNKNEEDITWEETLKLSGQVACSSGISISQIISVESDLDELTFNTCGAFMGFNENKVINDIKKIINSKTTPQKLVSQWHKMEDGLEDYETFGDWKF